MYQLQTIIDQQVPLSKVRANYNDIAKKAKETGFVLVLKNYAPHSIIMDLDFFLKSLNVNNQKISILENQKRSQAVRNLLKFRDKVADRVKDWNPMAQLTKDRSSH